MSGFDEKNFEFKNSFGKVFGKFVWKIKREKLFSLAADGWGPPVRTTSFLQPSLPNPLSQQQPPRPKPPLPRSPAPPASRLQVEGVRAPEFSYNNS